MKKYVYMALMALIAFCGCSGSSGTLLPNVSGSAGEVLVVIGKEQWDGELGMEIRDILEADCPYLVLREPLFRVSNVPPGSFNNMFKVHRNIVLMNVGPSVDTLSIEYRKDVWAAPQALIQVNAPSERDAISLIGHDVVRIQEYFEQMERDRIIRNSALYEALDLREPMKELTGGTLHFPSAYKLKKRTSDFLWFSDSKQAMFQDLLAFKFPAKRNALDPDNLVKQIIKALNENVPGMLEGSYMNLNTEFEPSVRSLKYKGREFMEVRGYWNVTNDYMGGPFVSHAFYSKDGKDVIVIFGFVYAPKFDKRKYLRQTDALVYSFEWAKDKDDKK